MSLAKEFELPRRLCSTCAHWSARATVADKGYLERICIEPPDDRDHKLKRGSDCCSRWKKDTWKPLTIHIDPYGY